MQNSEIIELLNKRNIEKKSILIERFNQKMQEIEALNELFADKNKRKFELLDSVIEGALASGTKTVIDYLNEIERLEKPV